MLVSKKFVVTDANDFVLFRSFDIHRVRTLSKRISMRRVLYKTKICIFQRGTTKECFTSNHLKFALFEINYLPLAKKMGWMWAAQMCQTLSGPSKGDQNI